MVAIIRVVEDKPKKRTKKAHTGRPVPEKDPYFTPLRKGMEVKVTGQLGFFIVVIDTFYGADAWLMRPNGTPQRHPRKNIITKGRNKVKISAKNNGTNLSQQVFQNNLQIIR